MRRSSRAPPSGRRFQPEDVDRAGALADAPAGRRGPPRRRSPWRPGRPRAGRGPSARCAASADECVQPEPCAAPLVVALARDLDEPLAVEEEVGGLLAVAAGEDDGARAERVDGADELLGRPRPRRSRAEHARLGHVRASRPPPAARSCVRSASWASSSSSRAPLSEIITGSSTTGASPTRSSASPTASIVCDAAEHADLDGVDADVVDHRPDLLDDHLARNRIHGGHRHRVLSGDRGDGRHPVHPAARERLEVRLNAGAAAGIRAGDGEDPG